MSAYAQTDLNTYAPVLADILGHIILSPPPPGTDFQVNCRITTSPSPLMTTMPIIPLKYTLDLFLHPIFGQYLAPTSTWSHICEPLFSKLYVNAR